MRSEFLPDLDEGMLEYFRAMADVLVEHFGISRAEAVARINERYGGLEIDPYPDIMCHEMPEYWAYGTYYLPDDQGRLPIGGSVADRDIDFERLQVRPAPPRPSRFWTIQG
ncbi:hypothetical protein [Streptomyces sp. HC307]|uniref:hypothetical protein n=1 Tax=Streptomyces flavusporus TaxID=3385496 RepID=UPI0039175833